MRPRWTIVSGKTAPSPPFPISSRFNSVETETTGPWILFRRVRSIVVRFARWSIFRFSSGSFIWKYFQASLVDRLMYFRLKKENQCLYHLPSVIAVGNNCITWMASVRQSRGVFTWLKYRLSGFRSLDTATWNDSDRSLSLLLSWFTFLVSCVYACDK